MALLDDLKYKKAQYESLKGSVKGVLSSINTSISHLEGPSTNIGNCYNINGQSADKNTIYNERNSLLSKRDYINNSVIPAINDNISSIEADIRKEEERIRREEEERRQREAAANKNKTSKSSK